MLVALGMEVRRLDEPCSRRVSPAFDLLGEAVQIREVGPQPRALQKSPPTRLPPRRPWRLSSSNAHRAVVRLTPKSETRSASLGNLSPTPISPDSLCSVSLGRIWWYSVPALHRDKGFMTTFVVSKVLLCQDSQRIGHESAETANHDIKLILSTKPACRKV